MGNPGTYLGVLLVTKGKTESWPFRELSKALSATKVAGQNRTYS